MTKMTLRLTVVILLSTLATVSAAQDKEREAAIRDLEEMYGEVSLQTLPMTLNPPRPDDLRLFLSTGISADSLLTIDWGDSSYELSPLQYITMFQCDNEKTAEVVQILVDGGVDPNRPHPEGGDPPLTRVVGCERIVKILLDAGADPDAKNKFGDTALRRAMNQFGSEESVRLLIEAGADVQGDKERLLKLSRNSSTTPGKKRLIEEALSAPPPKKLEPRDFRQAISERDVKVVRKYLGDDSSAATTPHNDNLPLVTLAARCKAGENSAPVLEILNLLLENGADVNAVGGVMKETALHPAARQCEADVVKALIDAGANVNAKDLAEHTPLFNAVMATRPGAVDVLLDAGAKVDRTTKFLGNSKPEIKPLLKKKRR